MLLIIVGEKLDEIDKKILAILVGEGVVSALDIARRMNKSNSTISYRIKKLEQEGIIEGYMPRVNAKKAGYAVTALLLVTVNSGKVSDVVESLGDIKYITQVYQYLTSYGLILILMAKDLETLSKKIDSQISRISGIRDIQTHILTKMYRNIQIPLGD